MSDEMQEIMDSNPEWYKDLQYKEVKKFIQDNINSTARSFVAIGYYLKYVRDNQLYKDDGYTGVSEFAKAEFGISAAQASKFMSINDRFSKDGNSPVLLEQYKDFSSSKLSEMLYLTDEQLDQVSITTTKAEIREIGKPAKEEISFSPAKTEPESKKPYYQCAAYLQYQYTKGCKDCFYDKADCPYDRTGYFAEIKRKEEWNIHCEILNEMCDCICKMMSYVLEKNNYSMDAIKSLSRKDEEFSFGFGNNGIGHSRYMAICKLERYHVEEFDGTGKWTFEAGEVDQHIWNFNGRDWHNKQREIVTETVTTEPEYIEPVSETVEIVDNEPEIVNDVDISEEAEPLLIRDPDLSCKFDPDARCLIASKESCTRSTDDGCMHCSGGWGEEDYITAEPEVYEIEITEEDVVRQEMEDIEQFETVEADIIQTAPEEPFTDQCETSGLKFNNWLKANGSSIADIVSIVLYDKKIPDKDNLHAQIQNSLISRLISKTEAYYNYLTSELGIEPEQPRQLQPELPILKNNDQRKDFIDAYETWPIWIDIKETGERYYRYDLTDKVAMVVKVSLRHSWREKEASFGNEQYHLLGIQADWTQKGTVFKEDDTRTFADCNTNKSALVEYLKEIQKKGA